MGSDNEVQSGRRTGRGRGRGRGRPPGRPSKKTKSPKKTPKSEKSTKKEKEINFSDKDIENTYESLVKKESLLGPKSPIDYEDSIETELTSLSFVTPASKALHGNEPLNWKYKVNLIGEKVVNPRIHCCEKCLLPILVYGRMIPCKHVFCLSCGQQNEKQCPRCGDKVIRVEKSNLGTVFMCQTESCKRTYLSQRDLQAHIEHRHLRRQVSANALNASNNANVITTANITSKDVSTVHSGLGSRSSQYSTSFQSPIPVVSSRSNLITVPIQDEVNSGMNSMSQTVSSQSSVLVSPPQPVSNYGVPQQNPFGHPNPHMQWPSIPTTNAYGYRPPPSWPQMSPYSNPFNRPYGYPQ